MKSPLLIAARVLIVALFLLVVPMVIQAQSEQALPEQALPEQAQSEPPPIEQPLIREGSLAVQLEQALGLGKSNDEVEAESRLGEVGIAPRNGWVADYPVTPDIIGELKESVSNAADSGKISMSKDEALNKLDHVLSSLGGLSIKPHINGKTYQTEPETAEDYPIPTVINNYYYNEGPPVVTYYTPPPDFYYLYGWVPYPFWWGGFWFSGFFILNDFHRHIHVGHRTVFVSNHFNDFRKHRVFRIDPVARFNGRTFAGIGVSNRHGFISTGVPRSGRTIFNAPRAQAVPGMRPMPGMRTFAPPPRGVGKTLTAPARGFTAPSRSFSKPSGSFTTPRHGFTRPSRGSGTFSPSTRGGGAFHGGRGFHGGGHRR